MLLQFNKQLQHSVNNVFSEVLEFNSLQSFVFLKDQKSILLCFTNDVFAPYTKAKHTL